MAKKNKHPKLAADDESTLIPTAEIRAEFENIMREFRDDIVSVRKAVKDVQKARSSRTRTAIASGALLLLSAVSVPVMDAVLREDPNGIGCSTEKGASYDLWENTGVWTPLPENVDQCDVNAYMEEVLDANPTP